MYDEHTAAARMIATFIHRFCVPSPEEPLSVWLIYVTKTGQGVALAAGTYKPTQTLRERKLSLSATEGDSRGNPVVQQYGPAAVRWHGPEIVVALGMNEHAGKKPKAAGENGGRGGSPVAGR